MRLRRGSVEWSRGRRGVAAGLIVTLACAVGACNESPTDALDRAVTAGASEADAPDVTAAVGDFTEGLDLSDEQLESIRGVFEEYRGRPRDAGVLWYAAADLQGILDSEQIAALETRREQARSEMLGLHRHGRRPHAGRRGRTAGPGEHGLGPRHEFGESPGADGARGEPWGALALTDEQIERIRKIRDSFAPEMEEVRQAIRDGGLTRDEARAKIGAIRESMHEAVQTVLTADQQALLEEHRLAAEARREEARARQAERREEARAAMAEALGLTPDQAAAIEALRERPELDGRPTREDIRELRDRHREALSTILDDTQQEVWVLHGSLVRAFARHQVRGRAGAGPTGPGPVGRKVHRGGRASP